VQELGIAIWCFRLCHSVRGPVVALVALKRANARPAASIDDADPRLETRIREMDQRLKALEPAAPPPPLAEAEIEPPAARFPTSAPTQPGLALEQRIGARWATWVGVLSLIITVGLLLRWTFENNLIGPVGRIVLGLATGGALLLTGLALRARRSLPFLAEGLSGGGLAILYLSLYAANTLYGFIGTGTTFSLMSIVTVSGIAVAVASDRQATAVLAVLGGLLTPILVSSEHPDERVLLAYLFVLGALVLGVATRRSWISLNRLAWTGSLLLLLAVIERTPVTPSRRSLAPFRAGWVFVAVPTVHAWRRGARSRRSTCGSSGTRRYFSAVYATLEPWRPLEGLWALALGAAYVAIAR
jgi:uncharacterized membrane protein